MKNLMKYILFLAIIAAFSSCNEEVGDFTVQGEAITNYELSSPDANDTIKINTSTLTETILFSWQEAESGLGSPIVYTIAFDVEAGDFSNPVWSKTADNEGASNQATLTYEELQEIFNAVKTGTENIVTAKWTVQANNGSPNVVSGQISYTIQLALSADGISNFELLSPVNKSAFQFDGTLEDSTFTFDWENAVSSSGSVLTYKFLLDDISGDFSSPLLTLDADNDGQESQVSMTYGEWKTLLESNNIEDGAYQWTVEAYSTDLTWMKNINEVYFEFVNWRKPIFVVGDGTSVGWDIDNAIEMTFVSPNVWTGALTMNVSKEFKFFPEKGSWDNGIGSDRFDNYIGCSDPGNGNIKLEGTEDGVYAVVVDLNTKTVTALKQPYILGGSVIADWNTDNAVPLAMVENGVYESYQYITVDGSGFKFIPAKGSWDGDFGKSKTLEGFLAQADEDNLTIETDGFYRVRVNFNDMSYSVDETSWGIIGSASPGGWDNDTNMEFTAAKGEYTWSADITLTDGDIKFRANDGWDINFGDTGADGSLEYGGENITVSAGNYHVELILDSSTGFTYTIVSN